MSLASYEINGTFASSVVIPSAEDRSKEEQKELFRPGLHGCPFCQAHELSRLGDNYSEIAGWLFDASLRTSLCSEKREDVTQALYRTGLLSDNQLRKDLEVSFHVTSKAFGPNNTKRRAGYSHLRGQGALCSADDEHDTVLALIRWRLELDITSSIPECRIEWLQDKRLDPSRRRPDLQAKVYVKNQILDHLAIEVQKSKIGLEEFQARHLVLSELATKATWLFRQSGINGRFRECINWALKTGISIGSYDVDDSGNLTIDKILDIPETQYEPSMPEIQNGQ